MPRILDGIIRALNNLNKPCILDLGVDGLATCVISILTRFEPFFEIKSFLIKFEIFAAKSDAFISPVWAFRLSRVLFIIELQVREPIFTVALQRF